jgi:hypothetical protein
LPAFTTKTPEFCTRGGRPAIPHLPQRVAVSRVQGRDVVNRRRARMATRVKDVVWLSQLSARCCSKQKVN